MNPIFRSAGVVVLGVGFFAWSSMKSNENFDRTVAHYDLNPAQVQFTRDCMSSLSQHDKEFKDGAKKHTGCGCIAATIGKDDQALDYQRMSLAFGSVVKFSETDERKTADFAGLLKEMTEVHGLTYAETMPVISVLGNAMDVCKDARLPKMNAVKMTNRANVSQPYQPTVLDAPKNANGCKGLSAESVATLQKIADRDGKSLEEMCANVVS